MRILANGRINRLFGWVLLLSVGFSAVSGAAVRLYGQGAAWFVLAGALCMGAMVCAALFFYFRQQEKIMEEAVEQIRAYLSGDRDARIDCDEEGELYRLFHEVNSLAATLNAHAENEGRSKLYLKDTISNISHQLKTPLAALNIYNGILQEEAQGSPTIREFADLSEQELDRMVALGCPPEGIIFNCKAIGFPEAIRRHPELNRCLIACDDLWIDRKWHFNGLRVHTHLERIAPEVVDLLELGAERMPRLARRLPVSHEIVFADSPENNRSVKHETATLYID